MDYYRKRMGVQISKKERCMRWEEVWERAGISVWVYCPREVTWVALNSHSNNVRQHTLCCPPGKLAQALVSMVFTGYQYHRLQPLRLQTLRKNRGSENLCWHKFSGQTDTAWLKVSGIQNTLIRLNISRAQSPAPMS